MPNKTLWTGGSWVLINCHREWDPTRSSSFLWSRSACSPLSRLSRNRLVQHHLSLAEAWLTYKAFRKPLRSPIPTSSPSQGHLTIKYRSDLRNNSSSLNRQSCRLHAAPGKGTTVVERGRRLGCREERGCLLSVLRQEGQCATTNFKWHQTV